MYIFLLYLTQFLEWEMFQLKVLEKITYFMFSISFKKSYHLWDEVAKYCCRAGQAIQYGACTFHAGYLSLQTHTQNMSGIGFTL